MSHTWNSLKNNKVLSETLARIAFLIFGLLMLTKVELTQPIYYEIDSYALPVISLQYRGSVVMTHEDIEQARQDFPNLYRDIFTYEDLRSSKLRKIDDEHWMAYYFPIYAIACMPMKLILQGMGLDQEKCFVITNVLFFLLAICFFWKNEKERCSHYVLITLLLVFNPILQYLSYIGAEPLMYSFILMAMVSWDCGYNKIAIILSTLAGMINPTAMGIVIIMFLFFCFNYYEKQRGELLNKKNLKTFWVLCIGFVFALIPFVAYGYTSWLGIIKNNLLSYDPYPRRVLAYLFDLNLGIASISILLAILFVCALTYSILKRKRKMLFYGLASFFTIMCFSIMGHINSGMIYCSRYVIWVLPVVIFTIKEFLEHVLVFRIVLRRFLLAACVFVQFVTVFVINDIDLEYGYGYFSNVAKIVLDNCPQLYISPCDSTFYNRVNHVDHVYILSEPAIYSSNESQEIRKIYYQNNQTNKDILINSIFSLEDKELKEFTERYLKIDDDKYYYINIGKNNEFKYYKKSELYLIVEKLISPMSDSCTPRDVACMVLKILLEDTTVSGQIFDYMEQRPEFSQMTDEEYVHQLYSIILERVESEEELMVWTRTLSVGTSRQSVLNEFLFGDEFQKKVSGEKEFYLAFYEKLLKI